MASCAKLVKAGPVTALPFLLFSPDFSPNATPIEFDKKIAGLNIYLN
jgi:hypothetical protein